MASTVAALDSSISDLQRSLDTLQPEIDELTSSVPAASIPEILAAATDTLHHLISFLSTRKHSTATARDNGELQAQLAHLFGTFAQAEGVAITDGHSCESALSDISKFHESRVSPLLREFSAVKERALVMVADAGRAVDAAVEEQGEAQKRVDANRESIAATSKHLDEAQATLNSIAYQMEALAERRRELEEKKQEAKERREIQRSSQAIGFLSIFVPVMAPVAAVANAFSTRTTDSELRRVASQLSVLRRQTEGLNPALIENALKELNIEHAALQRELEAAIAVVGTLLADKEALEIQMLYLETVHEKLDAVCQQLTAAQHSVAETAARAGDAAARAAHAKGLCAQGIVTVCRMNFSEGRRWVVALLSGVVDVVGEGKEELEVCKDEEQVDEGIESGGESVRKGSVDWSEHGDLQSPLEGTGSLVLPPTIEEAVESPPIADDEEEREGRASDCECEEDESDDEVPEMVDVGVETPVQADEEHNFEDEEELGERNAAKVETTEKTLAAVADTLEVGVEAKVPTGDEIHAREEETGESSAVAKAETLEKTQGAERPTTGAIIDEKAQVPEGAAEEDENADLSREPAPSETSESEPLLSYPEPPQQHQHPESNDPNVTAVGGVHEEAIHEEAGEEEERRRHGFDGDRKGLELVHITEVDDDISMPGGFHSPVLGN